MVHEGYLAWTLIGQNNFCFSLLNIEWLFTGACHNLVQIPSIVLKCLSYSQTYDFELLRPDDKAGGHFHAGFSRAAAQGLSPNI